MITFTDLVLLVLTVFVMTYAMSTPRQETWDSLVEGLSRREAPPVAAPPPPDAGPSHAVTATAQVPGADLRYLQAVIDQLAEAEPVLAGLSTRLENGRLVISLPAGLRFAPESTSLDDHGQAVLRELAPLLARVGNRLAIAGHTDPAPQGNQPGDGAANWELSLARAHGVARALAAAGLETPPRLLGHADTRPPRSPSPAADAQAAARRVELIVLPAGEGG